MVSPTHPSPANRDPFGRHDRWTLVYDGSCRMCKALVRRVRRWDTVGRLELLAAGSPDVLRRYAWIRPEDFAEALHLFAPDDRAWVGAAALEQLTELLPRGRRASWLFRLPLARRLAESIYRVVARNRHRLGCGAHCRVGEPHA